MVSHLHFSTSLGPWWAALGLISKFHTLTSVLHHAWCWHSLRVPTRSSPLQDDQVLQSQNRHQGQQATFLLTHREEGLWSIIAHGL